MASLEEALYSKLSATAGVTAIVPATRIFHVKLEENSAFPAITFQRISTTRDYVLTDTVQMAEATVQLDCWSASDSEAVALAKAVRAAIDGFRGAVSGVTIERILQLNEYTLNELEGTVYRILQTWRVIYQEP